MLTPEDVEMDLVPAMEVLLRDMEEVRLSLHDLSEAKGVNLCLKPWHGKSISTIL